MWLGLETMWVFGGWLGCGFDVRSWCGFEVRSWWLRVGRVGQEEFANGTGV